jgi:two-component system sensor kinase FixL
LRSFIGRDELAMEEEPLAPLVAEAAQAAWHYAADPSAELNFHLDPAATAMVDQVQLQQVVANLVRNAAEALRAGSVHNEVWVCLARTPDGGSIIDVSDTGPGLDPARRERLFDVFERSGKTGGMGVGLAICRTIVAAHGGRIWAEDNPGGGAVFRFTLPPVEQGLDLDV